MGDEREAGTPPPFLGAHHSLELPNGVRALLLPRPRSPTVALQLLVRAGSRHDAQWGPATEHSALRRRRAGLFRRTALGTRSTQHSAGLAHLVEHLVFRAPSDSRVDLYAAVESLGGEIGGGTTRDYTAFEIVLAAPHAPRALALLPSLIRAPATDPASFFGEQLVVCQELRERQSTTSALWDLLLAALWQDHPLVHGPGGTVDSVLALTPDAAAGLHTRWYRAPRVLVAAAGACSPAAFAAAVEESVGLLPPADDGDTAPAPPAESGRALHTPTAGSSMQVAVGLAVAGMEHADCAALRILDAALGHGVSSRLARALDSRGLQASVGSRYVPYAGAGVFAALATCAAQDGGSVGAVLTAELRRLAAEPPAGDELATAQRLYAGAVYRRCETNLGLASAAGVEALFAGDGPPLARTVTRVAELSAEEVAAVAARYFAEGLPARASLGPGEASA